MKKKFAVSAAILFAIGAISVNAADAKQSKIDFKDICESVKETGIDEDNCKIFDILEALRGCTDIKLPDFNLPEINLPDFILPESKPETDKPEADKPEADTPIIPEEKPEEKPEETPDEKPETDNDDGYTSESLYVNEILALVNKYRASNGLKAVSLDNALSTAADVRAKEIKTAFSHTRPDGRSCFTVLSDRGISYNGAGENIAYGQRSAEEVMNAWMNSEGHRANILNGSFTQLGVGVYSSGGTLYFVQLFTY